MIKSIKLVMLLMSIILPVILNATHMMGGEIFYKWLGGKKYQVTARIYRDCKGIPLNSPSIGVSDNNGTIFPISYTRTSIQDITPTCNRGIKKPCNPSNTTVSSEGYELHTFVGNIDLGAAPYDSFIRKKTCKIYFFISQCCKNFITNYAGGDFYLDAMLDVCNSGYSNSSPQLNSICNNIAYCNVPVYQNYGGNDFIDYDSLSFDMVTSLDNYYTPSNYSLNFTPKIPFSPTCVPQTTISCKAVPNGLPPRGFYFDSLNGDFIFTPSNCSEMSSIVVQTSEFRRDPSNPKNWLKVGYVKRDIAIIVKNTSYLNEPPKFTILGQTYKFKTRQKTCVNINTYDSKNPPSPAPNTGDTTSISMDLPPGATLRYLDSSAKFKTGVLCWNVHDSVYLKVRGANKTVPLFVSIKDNFCNWSLISNMGIFARLLPPDSIGILNVNSFNDINKNNQKNSQDSSLPVTFIIKKDNFSFYATTDKNGFFEDSIGTGITNIATAAHPYYKVIQKDTNLLIKYYNNHTVNMGVQRSPGIYGRIYEDKNANCKYDDGETIFSGHNVYTDSNKYVGVSDRNGIYYIKTPKGSYNLRSDLWSKQYRASCPKNNTISISVNDTGIYLNNDFSIFRDTSFEDLSVTIATGFLRRGKTGTVNFSCSNNGRTKRKNIQLKCPLYGNKFILSSGVYNYSPNTIATLSIDSILPGKTRTFKCSFPINPDSFSVSDRICFRAYLDSISGSHDTLLTNNYGYNCGVVAAPNDPNEKNVDADSFRYTIDSSINYTIHFQNTGTDTAIRIFVKDTIDPQYLSMDKFKLNWSDFPCETIISDKVITFIFDNIYLPHLAKGGDKSIAGFNFTLGLKSKVSSETSFKNHAAIYFDFEKPVFTKDAIASIVSPIVLTNLKTSGTCRNEGNTVYYKSNIQLDSGNQLILEMSDANGSFASPVVLNSISTTSVNDSINFTLPKSANGVNYTLRIRSTIPSTTSIPLNGYKNMKILAIPGYQVNSNLVNNSICEKDTLKLNFSNANHFYKIILNNIPLNSFNGNTSYKFEINVKDSFKIIAMDSSTGCKDTSIIQPVIHKKPIIGSGITNRKKEYCQGEQIEINASGGLYYTYLINNKILSGKSLNSKLKTTLDSSAIYRIKGDDNIGCTNFSDTMNIIVNPLPIATLTCSTNPVCPDDTAILFFGKANQYDLFKNNVSVLSKTSDSIFKIHSHNNGDKYYITAFSKNGCSANSSDFIINTKPTPLKPTISKNGNTLNTNATGTIKWYKNGQLISNTSNTINNADGGTYKVIVTNTQGCSTASDNFIHQNSEIQDRQLASFNIYPNPAHQYLTIENKTSGASFSVSIYNMNGQLMINSTDNNGVETIDIRALASGLYTVRLVEQSGNFTTRLISIIR